MIGKEELQTVFETIGKEFGFERIEADFSAFHELKVRWASSINRIDLKVSDYLKCADEKQIGELARVIFGKRKGGDVDFSVDFNQFCKSRAFREYAIPKYVKRISNAKEITGRFRVPDDVRVFEVKGMVKAFNSSRLMRVVKISAWVPEQYRQECVNVCMLDMNYDVGEQDEGMIEKVYELEGRIYRGE